MLITSPDVYADFAYAAAGYYADTPVDAASL